MILQSTQSLNIVLAGAKTTLDAIWYVSWEDVPVSGNIQGLTPLLGLPGSASGVTNGVTSVPVVPAPAAGFCRRILSIQLNNADTGAITPNWTINDNGTNRVVFKGTRATLEQANYTFAGGWQGYSAATAKQ
jgi:hypothetical protein